jgi:multidrug efflux pump subunit AcrB
VTIGIVGIVVAGALLFAKAIPAGFIPDEDQGIFGVNLQLPPGASLARTSEVLKKVEEILAKTDGVESYQDHRRLRRCYQHLPAKLWNDLRSFENRGKNDMAKRCTSKESWQDCKSSSPIFLRA